MPNLTLKALNRLMAEPWARIAANALDHLKPERQSPSLSVENASASSPKTDRHVTPQWTTRQASSSFDRNPPGYERLDESGWVIGLPLEGCWDLRLEGELTLGFREANLTITVPIPVSFEVDGFRLRHEGDLDSQLRLDAAKFTLDADVRLRVGQHDISLPAVSGAELVAKTSGVYGIGEQFSVPWEKLLAATSLLGHGEFDIELNLVLFPTLGFRLGGDVRLERFSMSHRYDHTFYTGIALPETLCHLVGAVGAVPRSWGEEPFREEKSPEPTGSIVGEALKMERALLRDVPLCDGPPWHHLLFGLIYEHEYNPDPSKSFHYLPDETYVRTILADRCDTAIWTGNYLAAEAFRYAAAPDPAQRERALERVELALEGIRKLFQVTREKAKEHGLLEKGLLARAALPRWSPVQTLIPMNIADPDQPGNYYHATVDGELWDGYGCGTDPITRDQYIGTMMGLGFAYQLVQTVEVRAIVRELVTDALNYILHYDWNVPTPGDPLKTNFINQWHHQLAFLRIGKTVNPEAFGKRYDDVRRINRALWFPVWGSTLDPVSDYYKFHLSSMSLAILLFLEDDPDVRKGYERAFGILHRATRHHRNAFFNLVRMLAEPLQDRGNFIEQRSYYYPDATSFTFSEEIRVVLRQWLLWRDQVAGPNGLPTKRTADPDYLLGLFPKKVAPYQRISLPIGDEEDEWNEGVNLVSIHALPFHKRGGGTMDFAWHRHPFVTGMTIPPAAPRWVREGFETIRANWDSYCSLFQDTVRKYVSVDPGVPIRECSGVDYLLAVWMAVYLEVIPWNDSEGSVVGR